jgi:hypothetical protein
VSLGRVEETQVSEKEKTEGTQGKVITAKEMKSASRHKRKCFGNMDNSEKTKFY